MNASSKLTAAGELIQEHSEYFHFSYHRIYSVVKVRRTVGRTFLVGSHTSESSSHAAEHLVFTEGKLGRMAFYFAADFSGVTVLGASFGSCDCSSSVPGESSAYCFVCT